MILFIIMKGDVSQNRICFKATSSSSPHFVDSHGELKIKCSDKIVSFICYLDNKEHMKI